MAATPPLFLSVLRPAQSQSTGESPGWRAVGNARRFARLMNDKDQLRATSPKGPLGLHDGCRDPATGARCDDATSAAPNACCVLL